MAAYTLRKSRLAYMKKRLGKLDDTRVKHSFNVQDHKTQTTSFKKIQRYQQAFLLSAKPTPIFHSWELYLMILSADGESILLLGFIDYASRLNFKLIELEDHRSGHVTLALSDTVKQFGFPKVIRTHKKGVFGSLGFKFCLMLMRIRHQKI